MIVSRAWMTVCLLGHMGALCLVDGCADGGAAMGWKSEPGGGAVRVSPVELPVPRGVSNARVELHLQAGGDTLFVARCGRSELDVSLQIKREGRWVAAPNQFCSYVLAPPLLVRPGQEMTRPLALPVDVSGGEKEYRVVVAIYKRWQPEQPPDSASSVPALLRTSNSFRVFTK